MTYDPLPMRTVTLERLALDLENYRIPVARKDENAALNYLYAQEDVYDTAKMIIRDGYFDNEVPIVVQEGEQHVVLEGNFEVHSLLPHSRRSVEPSRRHRRVRGELASTLA